MVWIWPEQSTGWGIEGWKQRSSPRWAQRSDWATCSWETWWRPALDRSCPGTLRRGWIQDPSLGRLARKDLSLTSRRQGAGEPSRAASGQLDGGLRGGRWRGREGLTTKLGLHSRPPLHSCPLFPQHRLLRGPPLASSLPRTSRLSPLRLLAPPLTRPATKPSDCV